MSDDKRQSVLALGRLGWSLRRIEASTGVRRLMMVEAVAEGRVSPGNVAKNLRGRPDLVRQLQRHQVQVERIPLMSVEVVAVDSGTILRSASVRSEHGLLVNDSLVVTSALDHGATALASSDRDFEPASELLLYGPADIPSGEVPT